VSALSSVLRVLGRDQAQAPPAAAEVEAIPDPEVPVVTMPRLGEVPSEAQRRLLGARLRAADVQRAQRIARANADAVAEAERRAKFVEESERRECAALEAVARANEEFKGGAGSWPGRDAAWSILWSGPLRAAAERLIGELRIEAENAGPDPALRERYRGLARLIERTRQVVERGEVACLGELQDFFDAEYAALPAAAEAMPSAYDLVGEQLYRLLKSGDVMTPGERKRAIAFRDAATARGVREPITLFEAIRRVPKEGLHRTGPRHGGTWPDEAS